MHIQRAQSIFANSPKSLHCKPLQDFAFFHTKIVTLSLVTFRMTLMSQKKEEVYNILIINNLYINIYFFLLPIFGKVTSDNLPITTFNALIFSNLRTQICHFSVSLFPELSLFEGNRKCTNGAILGVNR